MFYPWQKMIFCQSSQHSRMIKMCIAITKSGCVCSIKTGLVDGLCSRHRVAGSANETFVILVEKKGTCSSFGTFKKSQAEDSAQRLRLSESPDAEIRVLKLVPRPNPSAKEFKHKEQCSYIFSKGSSKGLRCERQVAENSLCSKHSVKVESPESGCNFILIKGRNKGHRCGGKPREGTAVCAKHFEKANAAHDLQVLK